MSITAPSSSQALRAGDLVRSLQRRLVDRLEQVANNSGDSSRFVESTWLRDAGAHGGGNRWGVEDTPTFNRASVNVSAIHYDDQPDKRLASATAISSIVHPRHPRAPSMHLHVSWTEMRDGSGYWRIMADMNPAIADEADRDAFAAALKREAPSVFTDATRQGDQYFYIPALKRHRGVFHFYLEQYATADEAADYALAQRVATAAIDAYGAIVEAVLAAVQEPTPQERAQQLAYHTLYLFQVLTLDRGTTSGLLVHDQNDVGIMGSLPGEVDTSLLASWAEQVPPIQGPLVRDLVAVLGAGAIARVDAPAKRALAECVRSFYRANPAALDLQARGDVVPPTVANHSALA